MSDAGRKPGDRDPAQAQPGADDNFLRRWARRKHEARQAPSPAPAESPPAAESGVRQPQGDPPKVLTDADMPPVESLDERSDFSLFMSPGVSEALRRQALNKLFCLPEINQRCPLDGEWFDGDGSVPLGSVITHEMRDEMERAAQKLKESAQNGLREADAAEAEDTAVPPAHGAYGDLPAPVRAQPEAQAADTTPLADEVLRKDQT